MFDWILILNVVMGVTLYNLAKSVIELMDGVIIDTWKNNRFN